MSSKTETEKSTALDPFKWVLSLALVVGGIYGYYYFDDYPVLYRVLALVPVVLVALLLAVWTQSGGAFWSLMKEARLEIHKVVWPSRQESTQTTLIVVAVVFLMAILLFLLDMLFAWLSGIIIG